VLSAEEMRQAAETELEMQHHLAALFEERRLNPRDDLMSQLLAGPGDGEEPLSPHELQNVMHQLISGGYETTTNALNHMMWQMVRFPEIVAELRADRSLVKNFCEESMRWESPVQGLWRTAKRDVEVSGTTIPEGSLCIVRYAAGNRDPDKFPEPETFDIRRPNAGQHLAFGAGVHFCPGAQLARQEMQIACNAILDRMDNFRLSRPLPHPVHRPSINFIPMKELWVGFDRRA
jgi:cytochrome P450